MSTRQAIRAIILILLAIEISACASASPIAAALPATQAATIATPTISIAVTNAPPTPLTCLNEAGRVQQDVVATTNPPQPFIIYLPPCYASSTDRYPVLYLLHGQTYTQDQWMRLGAATVADKLIHNNESMPFIIVMPDDHYWYVPAGDEFGARVVNALIPYVDAKYRTRAERDYRALGGLSRGGGWTAKLGFDHPELFGALGLHSPALLKKNAPYLPDIIKNIPAKDRPRLWLDIGEEDPLLGDSLLLEEVLTQNNYIHIFHRFAKDHSEHYWSSHIEQYMRWYVSVWQENLASQ